MDGEDHLADVSCWNLSFGPSRLSANANTRAEQCQSGPSGLAMMAKGFSARDSAMGRVEVISSLEWRRRWSDDQKRAIVAEAVAYGVTVNRWRRCLVGDIRIGRRHVGLCAGSASAKPKPSDAAVSKVAAARVA